MKKLIGILGLALVLTAMTTASELTWLTDMESAKTEAVESEKLILLSFSGSDWCGNCMRLEKTLFHSESFAAYADENFVLLNADFPMKKANKLSKEQTEKNEALAERYNKSGAFPTVLVLSTEGDVIGSLSVPEENAEAYLKQLKSMID